MSVGIVLHKSKLKELRQHFTAEEIYRRSVASSEVVSTLIERAELVLPLRNETDYSYAADRFAGNAWYLVGDAACFLDPLLSTGVHLATFGGMVAAASIGSAIRGEIDAADSSAFFNASYRRAYLRMLVVVSAFYQTHSGKDAYFREAQRLTAHDYSDSEMVEAFRHIITGVEDLRDVEEVDGPVLLDVLTRMYMEHYAFVRKRDEWRSMPVEDITRGMARLRVVNAVQEDFSLTPDTAVNGLYVTTEPRLSVRRMAASEGTRTPLTSQGIARIV